MTENISINTDNKEVGFFENLFSKSKEEKKDDSKIKLLQN